MFRASALTAALAALAFAGPALAAPPTVMSLDSCADQYVLALSPRASSVGLSARADDHDSYMRASARGLPVRRATTEAVLVPHDILATSAPPRNAIRVDRGTSKLSTASFCLS